MNTSLMSHIRDGAGDPPIVFVHGYLCNHRNWSHQIDYFKATNTVIACDLRGLGETKLGDGEMTIEQMGQDVADLLEVHDLKQTVLVGHSMGCRVIMEANRRASDRISGLVLVDGSRGGQNCTLDQESFDRAIAENGYRAFVKALFDGMFFGDPPKWKASALEAVFAVPESIGSPLYRNLIAWDAEQLEAAMREIDVPVLILQSTFINLERRRARLSPREISPYQELVTAMVRDAFGVTIPSGHFTMIEASEETNLEIGKFLERVKL